MTRTQWLDLNANGKNKIVYLGQIVKLVKVERRKKFNFDLFDSFSRFGIGLHPEYFWNQEHKIAYLEAQINHRTDSKICDLIKAIFPQINELFQTYFFVSWKVAR